MIMTFTIGDGTSNFVPKRINVCVLALQYSVYRDGRVGISVGDSVYLINENEEQVLAKFEEAMELYCKLIK